MTGSGTATRTRWPSSRTGSARQTTSSRRPACRLPGGTVCAGSCLPGCRELSGPLPRPRAGERTLPTRTADPRARARAATSRVKAAVSTQPESFAPFSASFPTMKRLGLDDDASAQLLSRERDVVTAACGDQHRRHPSKERRRLAAPWTHLALILGPPLRRSARRPSMPRAAPPARSSRSCANCEGQPAARGGPSVPSAAPVPVPRRHPGLAAPPPGGGGCRRLAPHPGPAADHHTARSRLPAGGKIGISGFTELATEPVCRGHGHMGLLTIRAETGS